MTMKTIIVDSEHCSNCSLCVIACKDEHVGNGHAPWTAPQAETGQFWMDIQRLERGTIPRLKVSFLPISCQHCERPTCRTACPTGAIKQRNDGLVWIDQTLCNGCGLCVKACPYDAIFLDEERGIAQKCTGCAHRVDEGHLPRCVEACPHDVFEYVDLQASDLSSDPALAAVEVLHPEYGTQPRVLWRNLPKPRLAAIVVDQEADELLAGARVSVSGATLAQPLQTVTDAFGQFALERLPPETELAVLIEKDGYLPWTTTLTTEKDHDLGDVVLLRAR
jgi:Fe-S-cluster-containing dehydrogenase component